MLVELDKISKYYDIPGSQKKREVLDNISLQINAGDSMAIVGPSGSGKSTLLNIIGTLDPPSIGTVRFKGDEINLMNEKQLTAIRNQHIGFVFQLHHLLPQLNLIENVLVPTIPLRNNDKSKEVQERAMELLESVNLADKVLQRPGQLSVGECQRAAVVRALINEPEILLADEPTGSLDQKSSEQIGELLANINSEKKIAIVIVTHSDKLAGKMKNVFRLENGKLIK